MIKNIAVFTREELIEEIAEYVYEHSELESYFELLKEGHPGFENMTNQQLKEEYGYIGEDITVLIDDYKDNDGLVTLLFMNHSGGPEKSYNKDRALALVHLSKKPIKYTHGLGYRGPSIHNQPITKDKALEIIEKESLIDIRESEAGIQINTYSNNDLF